MSGQGSPENLAWRLIYGDPRTEDHATIRDRIILRRSVAGASIEDALRDHVLISTEALEQAAEVLHAGYLAGPKAGSDG